MPAKGKAFLLFLLTALLSTGCDPFSNAEKLFPLPDEVWDRAVSVPDIQAFVIKDVSAQEFINLKVLLLADGCTEHKLDFNFTPVSGKKPLTVKSVNAVLLLGTASPGSEERRAAVYLEKEHKLLLGIGTVEPDSLK